MHKTLAPLEKNNVLGEFVSNINTLFNQLYYVQTSCAVRNSGISLANASALMAYNALCLCVNGVVSPFPTFYDVQAVILS